MDDRAQAGGLAQVRLSHVPVDDDLRALADAGEEHLDLGGRGVLRLVEDHEAVLEGAPAHDLEGDHLDVAGLERDLEGRLAHALLHRLGERGDPGRDLLLQRAGEVAERAPAGHVGAGDDDLGDLALAQEVGGAGARDVGLAGAGGAEDDDLLVAGEGVEVLGLSRGGGKDGGQVPFLVEPRPMQPDRAILDQFKSRTPSLHRSTL